MGYSNSSILCFARCPLQHHFRYDAHLSARNADSHDMMYGSAMHKGLAVLYRGGTLKAAQDAFLEAYPMQIDLDDRAKTRPNGVKVLAWYVQEYANDWERWDVLQCEDLQKGEDEFVVKLDLVVRDRETNQVLGIDHKITGRYLNFDYWSEFEPNSQISEYIRYIKEAYEYCDGFIINAVSLRFRQKAYKGEPAGFWSRLERQTFNRNDEQLEQDYNDRLYWISRIEAARAANYWGKNTSSCRFCPYKDICKVGWTWEQDKDLILLNYMQVCGEPVGEDYCNLEGGHDGEHAYVLADGREEDFKIEIAV